MSHDPTDTATTLSPTRQALVEVLVCATALRDELDRTLQRADGLQDQAEALVRALLGGQAAALAPLRGPLQQTAQSLGLAQRWLRGVDASLGALGGQRAVAQPQGALPPPQVEGLLGLLDGLALLTPWGSAAEPADPRLLAVRAAVGRVLLAALRGQALAPALAELTEQQSQLLALGPDAQPALQRLGESIEALLQGTG